MRIDFLAKAFVEAFEFKCKFLHTVYHQINARALINFKHLPRLFGGTGQYMKEAIIKSTIRHARCNVIVKQ
jgi:hypothetical protein